MKPTDVAGTTIGQSVRIRGEVTGSENLYMDGCVEGAVSLAGSRLTVGPNARMIGNVTAEDVIVEGMVQGDIRATGKVELRPTARVLGDIFTARLSMEDLAAMTGKIEILRTSSPLGEIAQSRGAAVEAAEATSLFNSPVAQ